MSDAIVERGDDETLNVLLRNESAELSRQAHETAVDRARPIPALHEAVIDRRSLPSDLFNEMYFVVEASCATRSWSATPRWTRRRWKRRWPPAASASPPSDGALPAD